jgi:hypothetical protein
MSRENDLKFSSFKLEIDEMGESEGKGTVEATEGQPASVCLGGVTRAKKLGMVSGTSVFLRVCTMKILMRIFGEYVTTRKESQY